jgi:hypothetical protein
MAPDRENVAEWMVTVWNVLKLCVILRDNLFPHVLDLVTS